MWFLSEGAAYSEKKMRCKSCGKISEFISETIGYCVDCIRSGSAGVRDSIAELHRLSRRRFGLPEEIPRDEDGIKCPMCVNECTIGEGKRGFCGLRKNEGGKLVHSGGTKERGLVDWYYDPLPTNCVADWVCPGGTDCGYPKYSYSRGAERGYKNLAVFYRACTFNCLFCQNWHFKEQGPVFGTMSAEELAGCVDDRTSCVCHFGGDPTAQMMHAIETSEIALRKNEGRILRICWETNGSMNRDFLDRAAELSLKSGGCIKFDLKAWNENLNKALTGTTNIRTLENFRYLGKFNDMRKEPSFLIASTLLVPGYIDAEEIKKIAEFIASIDENIPYSLLGFHPQFYMTDLPPTPRKLAEECAQVCRDAGLKRIKIGNIHLLW